MDNILSDADTDQLSLRFKRCISSEVVTLETLSEDYSKIVFLHDDRHSEFHSVRFLVPSQNTSLGEVSLAIHYPSHDSHFVGTRAEVYKLRTRKIPKSSTE